MDSERICWWEGIHDLSMFTAHDVSVLETTGEEENDIPNREDQSRFSKLELLLLLVGCARIGLFLQDTLNPTIRALFVILALAFELSAHRR